MPLSFKIAWQNKQRITKALHSPLKMSVGHKCQYCFSVVKMAAIDSREIYLPTCAEFIEGFRIYNQKERRGPIWFDALRIVQDNWGNFDRMSEGVRLIINGWNRFYARYNDESLADAIKSTIRTLDNFRNREIASFKEKDKANLLEIFELFQDALKRTNDGRKSPVSVAKALSLFAPNFSPIWDSNIAFAYGFVYVYSGSEQYLGFIACMKFLAEHVSVCVPKNDDRPLLLKRIDEFNYSKHTAHWV